MPLGWLIPGDGSFFGGGGKTKSLNAPLRQRHIIKIVMARYSYPLEAQRAQTPDPNVTLVRGGEEVHLGQG